MKKIPFIAIILFFAHLGCVFSSDFVSTNNKSQHHGPLDSVIDFLSIQYADGPERERIETIDHQSITLVDGDQLNLSQFGGRPLTICANPILKTSVGIIDHIDFFFHTEKKDDDTTLNNFIHRQSAPPYTMMGNIDNNNHYYYPVHNLSYPGDKYVTAQAFDERRNLLQTLSVQFTMYGYEENIVSHTENMTTSVTTTINISRMAQVLTIEKTTPLPTFTLVKAPTQLPTNIPIVATSPTSVPTLILLVSSPLPTRPDVVTPTLVVCKCWKLNFKCRFLRRCLF